MHIEQFENKYLSHFSYALLDEETRKVILIDPSRDPQPYYDFARQNKAAIIAVIETHPHADFVSSHLEIHKTTGAKIYTSKLTGALYPHESFDDGAEILIGKISIRAINTPGHSPDSISVLLTENGLQKALFSGDTLFIGDCGRPDLRENAGEITAGREELAAMMFDSLQNKLDFVNDDVLLYPAHGAGTLCGKALKKAYSSTMGAERKGNWSLNINDRNAFIAQLLDGQPLIPAYFKYNVELNRTGAPNFLPAIKSVPLIAQPEHFSNTVIIDTRSQENYKASHLRGSINLMNETKFETWLGTLLKPETRFYLTAENQQVLEHLTGRVASIGYEPFMEGAFVFDKGNTHAYLLDLDNFGQNCRNYTILDIRNNDEREEKLLFSSSHHIPLAELPLRWAEIPVSKPIVVHCAAGFRSAAGSSFLQSRLQVPIYDLGENVKKYQSNKEAVQC